MKQDRINICFWCSRPFDGQDIELNENSKVSINNGYTPCDRCTNIWNNADTIFIECNNEPNIIGQTPLNKQLRKNSDKKDIYPTGNFITMPAFIATSLFDLPNYNPDSDEPYLTFITHKTYEELKHNAKAIT